MNDSIKKLLDDFMKKVGNDDLKMLETVPSEVALNYVYFLYNKFYEAYPTGDLYEMLTDIFARKQAA